MGVRDRIAKALTGIKAYHSSPHDFDKFDLSKIGTGEGAQVYGHGLYFAENPAVSGQGGQYWNQFANRFKGPESSAANIMKLNNFDREAAIEHARRALAKEEEALRVGQYVPGDPATAMSAEQMGWHPALIQKQQEVLRLLESGNPVGPRTYEVNINADPVRFLDWNKPLYQQPHIEDAAFMQLMNTMSRRKATEELDLLQNKSGDQLYRTFSKSPREASQILANEGIPGIRYLDEGSRAPAARMDLLRERLARDPNWNGGGSARELAELEKTPLTSNYVVFDPGVVDIMKKYGVVGAPAATLGMGAIGDETRYEPQ